MRRRLGKFFRKLLYRHGLACARCGLVMRQEIERDVYSCDGCGHEATGLKIYTASDGRLWVLGA